MGVTRGALTFTRLFVQGKPPKDLRKRYLDAVRLRKFQPLSQVGIQVHRLRRFIELSHGQAKRMGVEFIHCSLLITESLYRGPFTGDRRKFHERPFH